MNDLQLAVYFWRVSKAISESCPTSLPFGVESEKDSNDETDDTSSLSLSLGEESQYEKDTARIIKIKDEDSQLRATRCNLCWKIPLTCICEAVKDIRESFHGSVVRQIFKANPMRFYVYMAREEYRCGGNSGKLIDLLFPLEAGLFIHGCRDDAERLREVVANLHGKVCILFPGTESISVHEWLNPVGIRTASSNQRNAFDVGREEYGRREEMPKFDQDTKAGGTRELLQPIEAVILVDGTWHQARRMAKYLRRTLFPDLPQVSLSFPSEEKKARVSIFHRKQSQEGRICTAEALSMFVSEVLAVKELSKVDNNSPASAFNSMIVKAIKLTNSAICPTRQPSKWFGEGGHPAWYYGQRLFDGITVTNSGLIVES